jgi:hypothetical protein
MKHTPATTADNGGTFGATQAAALLTDTTQQARRQLEPARSWLLVIRAVLVLVACGVVWLSVRGQHPYRGPTSAVIPVLPTFGVADFIATVTVAKRATAGVAGRSRLHRSEIAVLTVAWVAPFVAIWPVAAAGVSPAIAYGLLPAAVPLLAAGLTWAPMMAVRRRWRSCGTGLAVAAVGAVGVLVGPAGAWLSMGIGLCAVLLASALVIVRQQHHAVVRA